MTLNKRQRNNHSKNESAAAGIAQMSDEVRNTLELLTPEEPSSPIPLCSEDLMDRDAFQRNWNVCCTVKSSTFWLVVRLLHVFFVTSQQSAFRNNQCIHYTMLSKD